ncbi:MAG: C25 family cysteine peptidase, partial [bacterium]
MEPLVSTPPTINIVSGSRSDLTLKISLHGMLVEDTIVNGITYHVLSIPKCAQISDIGKPMLPFISEMIAIHPQRQVRLSADSLEFIVLDNYYVFPAQYPQNGSVYQVFPFVIDETLYTQNIFYPGITTKYKRPAIFRDLRVSNLSLFPVFFNPQTHQLRVLKKAILRASFSGTDSINTLPTWPTSVAPLYGNIYRSTILNYNTLGIPDEVLWTRPRYLIISDGSFADDLNPFIFWKTKKGLEIFLETITTPEQRDTLYIKDLITDYYNHYNISYVLLVGDGYERDQPGYPPLLPIPDGWEYQTVTHGAAISDHWYTCIAGDDDIADVALGRFSIWTNEQLNRVTEKLFSFERYPNAGEWFIKRNVLVSHKEEWPGEYHECKTESIVPIITLYGFQYFDDWGGYYGMSNEVVKLHINDPASPSTNKGSSLLNYRGHGVVKAWEDWCSVPPTSFTNDDIYSLTNFVSMNNAWLPIVFENCCCCGRIGRTSPLSDTTGHSEC